MKTIFQTLGKFTERRHVVVLIVALMLLLGLGTGLSRIEMKTGLETFLSTDSQLYKDYSRFNDDFGSDMIMVLIEGDDLDALLQPANLRAMSAISQEVGPDNNPKVISAQSPALYIRQELDPEPGEPIPPLPDDLSLETAREIVTDPETGEIRPELARLLPDDKHALIMIVLQGNLPEEDQKDLLEQVQNSVDAAQFQGVEPVITGDIAVSTEMESLLMKNMGITLGMAVVLLFLILAVIFKVRGFFPWRWLPLGVVGIGVIYAFGLMGLLNIYLTMMTMSCFPILIGLGIDYGIQFHNRYDEEASRGQSVGDAIIESATHIGPAVGIALVAGCLGFAALFFSPVPMIQDFGLMLIIGVVASYIVALFPLLAILYWHDRRNNHAPSANKGKKTTPPTTPRPGFVERGLQYLAPHVIRHPFIIVPIAVILTVVGLSVDSRIAVTTDEADMVSQDIPAIKSYRVLEDVMGGLMAFNILAESDDVTRPETLQWIADLEDRIMATYSGTDENPGLVVATQSIASLVRQENDDEIPSDPAEIHSIIGTFAPSMKKNLINGDAGTGKVNTAANISVTIAPMSDGDMKGLKNDLKAEIAQPPSGTSVVLTGFPAIRVTMVDSVTDGRVNMTLIGIGLIFAGLLILFRLRILRAIYAILPIVLIIGWAALFMFATGIDFTVATATFGALIMGIGVEFTILLMMRYYEEREKGKSPHEAMTTAMTKIGRAVTVSAFTTIGGFAALLLAFDFPILIDFGMVTMINVFFALVASLLVLPSVIVWIDTQLDRRRPDTKGEILALIANAVGRHRGPSDQASAIAYPLMSFPRRRESRHQYED